MSRRKPKPADKLPRYVVFRVDETNNDDAHIVHNIVTGVTFYNALLSHDDYRRALYAIDFARDKRMADAIERRVLADLDTIEDAGDPHSQNVTQYVVCTVH